MTNTDAAISGASLSKKRLQFTHFPAYARFLLSEQLDEYTKTNLQLARSLNWPLLKPLESIPDEQLIEIGKKNNSIFLNYAIENRLDEQISDSISRWKNDEYQFISREEVMAEDISLISYFIKTGLLRLVSRYTNDNQLILALVGEIDEYLLNRESAAFGMYMEIQQAKLNVINNSLHKSEARYFEMLREVQDYAIVPLDKQGRIMEWPSGAEKICGLSAADATGNKIDILYTEEDCRNGLPQQLMEEAVKTGRVATEGRRLRKDGSWFWANTVLTAIHDSKGEVTGFLKVTRDLTEKKKMDDQLLLYSTSLEQKNRELEQINRELESFAYIASHDLQEPLRNIKIFSDLIREAESKNLSARGAQLFSRIISATGRMQKLIEDLLAFSQIQSARVEFEAVNLNAVLRETELVFTEEIREKGVKINAADLPVVMGIPFQLQQLLGNVISNAIKYRKKDTAPQIDITCETVYGSAFLSEGVVPGKRYYRITVSDNGIGFEQKYAQKIFEVFQRLHGKEEYSGTGIGLAICKKIVQTHGGFIYATGSLNEGASFFICLPCP